MAPSRPGPTLDPRLDCIVEFLLAAPVAAERVIAAAAAVRRVGSKPVAVEVDLGDGSWSVPQAGADAVHDVRVGVLTANRHGPLNAMEYAEFGQAVQAVGRAIGAEAPRLPEMAGVLEHARALDDACAKLDAVLGITVETPTAMTPAELATLARSLGLAERGNTRHALLGADGEVVHSLALGDRAQALTLLLDVPRVAPTARAWARMVECAGQCALRTGGRLVDDAGRPLTDAALAALGRQLEQRYAMLHEAGLDAGSAAALRVFN